MAFFTAKLLKVGGPIVTSIGGVIATSSLVSKSAEEKEEEKIKTKSLTDEEPLIDPWKDQNENEQQQESQEDEGKSGKDSPNSEISENQNHQGQTESDTEANSAGGEGSPQPNVQSDNVDDAGQKGGSLPLGVEGSDKSQEDLSKLQNEVSESDPEKSELGAQVSGGESDSDNSDSDEVKEEGSDRGAGVTEGSQDAQHDNALGNAYGNIDREMTKEEKEKLVEVKGSLEGIAKQLAAMIN